MLLDVYVCVVESVGGRFAGNGRVGVETGGRVSQNACAV
jgi:hypothetical protein